MAAGNLLDIYGKYNRALANYLRQANEYNTAGNAWDKAVKDYNASIISDKGKYDPYTGNYAGGGPYTYYNGYTIGRTGNPIQTYQTDPAGYNIVYDYNKPINIYSDAEGNQVVEYASSQVPYYTGTNETTYVNPNTGLASVFAPRPADKFDMPMPIAPEAPPAQTTSSVAGNVEPTTLYQSIFGKGTPDSLSNEAWGLQNITSPFLSSESGTVYDTGNINRMNNPLTYVGPDALTTGQSGYDVNSVISGQMTGNPYY